MMVHVGSAEPRRMWYQEDPTSSTGQDLIAKVDRLFENVSSDGTFEIKAGLQHEIVTKEALAAFYNANRNDGTIVDQSTHLLKVIIELTGTHPAPLVKMPTAPADAHVTKYEKDGMRTGLATMLQNLCDPCLKCDDQGTFLCFSQQDKRTMQAFCNMMVAEAKKNHGEKSVLPVVRQKTFGSRRL